MESLYVFGADGNIIICGDYVAIRYDDGSQSPVIGRVTAVSNNGLIWVDERVGEIAGRRFVRTSIETPRHWEIEKNHDFSLR